MMRTGDTCTSCVRPPRPSRAWRGSWLGAVVVVAAAGALLTRGAAGQGLLGVQDFSNVGADLAQKDLMAMLPSSAAGKQAFRLASSRGECGALCSAGSAGGDVNHYAVLMLATSPADYSSGSPADTGGLKYVPPAEDQRPCATCTSFAVVAAAEAAVAAVSKVDASKVQLSVQDHYFCSGTSYGLGQQCDSGSSMPDALKALTGRAAPLVKRACLPYSPDPSMESTNAQLCAYKCKDTDAQAAKGTFSAVKLSSLWAVQRHIRRYGGVVTRVNIYSDFRDFFKANPKGVYPGPGPGAHPEAAHAVLVYGYSNSGRFWLALNSWGPGFADSGSFRVAYGAAGVMAPGETFGVEWTPKPAFKAAFRVKLVAEPQSGNCYTYTARQGDYLSGIAEALWGPGEAGLLRLLRDNARVIKDLDAPLPGKELKVCGVTPDAVMTTLDAVSAVRQCPWNVAFGLRFEGMVVARGVTATSSGDCCALCRATAGCQFYDFVEYTASLSCGLYGLSKGNVTVTNWTKSRGGMNCESGLFTVSSEAGGVLLFDGIDFQGGDIGLPHSLPGFGHPEANQPIPGFTNGLAAASWQECARRCQPQRFCDAFTLGADGRCWLKLADNPISGSTSIRIVKSGGIMSGVLNSKAEKLKC